MNYETETLKQQALSFRAIGATCGVTYINTPLTPVYAIIVVKAKLYRFSDPDINVIIAQLATFYLNIKKMDLLNDIKPNEDRARRA